jgi:cytochrome c peroxidase
MRRALGFAAAVLALAGGLLARASAADDAAPQRGVPNAFQGGALVVPKGLPRPVVPESNPLTAEKIALGRRLFFDPALSRDKTKSCAHCHMPGSCFADGRRTALGVGDRTGTRNVPTLVNAAVAPALFWDGRASSLEAQAEGPILAPAELDMPEELLVSRVEADAAYGPLFEAAFGSKTVALRRIAYALASYERTLLAADSAFDRYWFAADASALSPSAERGYVIFRTKGACASCHVVRAAEAPFSDFEYHATAAGADGDDDPGRFAVTKREADRGRFRTPSLRNVALTAPYFHDGSAATLREVIDHYDRGGKPGRPKEPEIRALGMTEREKQDLEEFLKALTSPGLLGGPTPVPAKEPAK